jgi:hypothetical protein
MKEIQEMLAVKRKLVQEAKQVARRRLLGRMHVRTLLLLIDIE